jgi:uncharacterized protein (TIGR02271 family)
MSSNDFPWNEIIKKEARGIDDADFGEIQSVDPEYVLTQKGIIDKEFFSFPVNLVQEYDGNRVLFKVTEEEARNSYMRPQNVDDTNDFSNSEIETETAAAAANTTPTNDYDSLINTKEKEEVIPLMSEKLDVIKKELVDETVIIKKPVKETKTVEVQLIREEIERIERRPPSGFTEARNPVESPEEIKIPLKREEAEVTKKPYVKEEVVVKKKTIIDKKEITEDITSEDLDNSKEERE